MIIVWGEKVCILSAIKLIITWLTCSEKLEIIKEVEKLVNPKQKGAHILLNIGKSSGFNCYFS